MYYSTQIHSEWLNTATYTRKIKHIISNVCGNNMNLLKCLWINTMCDQCVKCAHTWFVCASVLFRLTRTCCTTTVHHRDCLYLDRNSQPSKLYQWEACLLYPAKTTLLSKEQRKRPDHLQIFIHKHGQNTGRVKQQQTGMAWARQKSKHWASVGLQSANVIQGAKQER